MILLTPVLTTTLDDFVYLRNQQPGRRVRAGLDVTGGQP